MKIKVAQYIADFLVEHGVEHNFTVTGGGAMHLNDAFGHKEGLKSIYNHHEQGCAIAAEGYARLTGKVALVCVTSGPGGTNAITGVVGGWQDSIPMFVVSGQVKRPTTTWATDVPLRQLGDQEFQIVDSVKNMTKYAVMITEPESIRYHLEKAWFLCNNGRKGPVWIDVPVDVQAALIETDNLEGFNEQELEAVENPVYDCGLTEQILDRIHNATRPVILVGTGIRLGKAYDILHQVTTKLGIPIVTAWNAHDVMADDDECYCGRPGSVGTRGGNFVVQNSDLLLVLGCRLNIRQISYNYAEFAKKAYKIVVDIDKYELQKPTVKVDMPVNANVYDVLNDMDKKLQSKTYSIKEDKSEWLNWCKEVNKKYPACLDSYRENTDKLNPYVFIDEYSKLWEKDDVVVCGNGSACVITFQSAHIKDGQRLFTNSGCAAMGYGFPASVGCAVAKKGERVICIDGDGSFMMNIQELQTASYNGLNLKIVILNNNGYHSIRQTQTNLFKPPMVGVNADNGVSFPDFEKVAAAFGASYLRITSASEIADKVKKMNSISGPVICEVIVDEKQNFEPKLSSKVLEDGTIVSPEIDDMYPFLDRDEYMSNKLD